MSGSRASKISLFCLVVLSGLSVGERFANALPWDTDLFKQQSYKPNEMSRNPVPGTIPYGYKPFPYQTIDDAEKGLKNTEPFSTDSVWRGRRAFTANCATCHGPKADGKGPVGPKMNVPNILEETYKGRGDGRIFGIVKLGGTGMPRYGFKFSDQEIWDVVNYVRFLQGKDVEGIERPK